MEKKDFKNIYISVPQWRFATQSEKSTNKDLFFIIFAFVFFLCLFFSPDCARCSSYWHLFARHQHTSVSSCVSLCAEWPNLYKYRCHQSDVSRRFDLCFVYICFLIRSGPSDNVSRCIYPTGKIISLQHSVRCNAPFISSPLSVFDIKERAGYKMSLWWVIQTLKCIATF